MVSCWLVSYSSHSTLREAYERVYTLLTLYLPITPSPHHLISLNISLFVD
ncbi:MULTISPECIES: hypothetical protein [Fischerella]|nr:MULTISPECIES: hypothetical protein [Fischerella]MBD2429624.1 hypothetical protein [Fischerella sp. FACHB-380]